MPINEETYKFIREIFCEYLEIKNRKPLAEIIYTKNFELNINEDENSNEKLPDKKIPLKDRFVNLFKSEKKPPTKQEEEEEKRNDDLKKLDEKILNLAEVFKIPNISVNEITKDTPLLSKDFELIINTRKVGNSETGEDLDIYKSYLDILLNIEENLLEPFGFYLANNLFEKNNFKKIRDYDKYIIICAITCRFIALYNKKILLKQLEELLRNITKTLYKCYNRSTSTAVSIKSSITDRFTSKSVNKGLEAPVINEMNPNTSKLGGNIQVGGLLYLNTDPEMKKTEGKIIMLNNLFQSKELTVQSLTQEYNATSSSKVSWLIDILIASGVVLSGGLLGVFASSASTLALTIGNSSLCGITGGVWAFSRDAILKSYHFSKDLDDTLKKLKEEFDLHYNDSDTNKKINECPGVKESTLKPVYKGIDAKIKQFSDTVIVNYQKYLDIFEFIVKSRQNILGDKFCNIPEKIVLTEKDTEFREVWQPELQDILDKWPSITGTKINARYIKTRQTDFDELFKAIGINIKCPNPTTQTQLKNAIDDMSKMSGQPLIDSLKKRFLCAEGNNPPTLPKGGNRKTKRLKKEKTQKHSRKGKTYKHQ